RRQREENGAAGQAVERGERRCGTPEDRRRAALQAAFLPEIERRQRSRERESRERGEHEADVHDEKEVRVVAARADPRTRARLRRRRAVPARRGAQPTDTVSRSSASSLARRCASSSTSRSSRWSFSAMITTYASTSAKTTQYAAVT